MGWSGMYCYFFSGFIVTNRIFFGPMVLFIQDMQGGYYISLYFSLF